MNEACGISDEPRIALRRRGFLALGGAGIAAVVLPGCGDEIEQPNSGRDVELLSAALVGEENTASILRGGEFGERTELLGELGRRASQTATRLQGAIADLDAAPAPGDFEPGAGAGDAALEAALEQTNAAIAAYRLGAGQFSTPKLRGEAIGLIAEGATRAGILNGLLADPEAPHAFVTGATTPPFESSSNDEEEPGTDEDTPTTTTTEEGS